MNIPAMCLAGLNIVAVLGGVLDKKTRKKFGRFGWIINIIFLILSILVILIEVF